MTSSAFIFINKSHLKLLMLFNKASLASACASIRS